MDEPHKTAEERAHAACSKLLMSKRLWTVVFTESTYELGFGDADLSTDSAATLQGFLGYELHLPSGEVESRRVPVGATALPGLCGATVVSMTWDDETGSLKLAFDNNVVCVAKAGDGGGEGYVVSNATDKEIWAF